VDALSLVQMNIIYHQHSMIASHSISSLLLSAIISIKIQLLSEHSAFYSVEAYMYIIISIELTSFFVPVLLNHNKAHLYDPILSTHSYPLRFFDS
jgi:hypothetical protein